MHGASADSVDVVLIARRGRRLTVLFEQDVSSRAPERWRLPWEAVDPPEPLDQIAARIAHRAAGERANWLVQAGAFAGGTRHPAGAPLSVGYLGAALSRAAAPRVAGKWFPAGDLPLVPPRHREILDAVLAQLREHAARTPVAFHLLGTTFTLSELQAVYELLLGRRLHKASFRRSLKAALLVEATEEWTSEGRGRPARLFRYVPRRRHPGNGGARLELFGG